MPPHGTSNTVIEDHPNKTAATCFFSCYTFHSNLGNAETNNKINIRTERNKTDDNFPTCTTTWLSHKHDKHEASITSNTYSASQAKYQSTEPYIVHTKNISK
jgi:hypothetical protein